MGFICSADDDGATLERLPDGGREANVLPAGSEPPQDGLLMVDAEGRVTPLDLKAITHNRRTIELNQRFTREVPENTLQRIKVEHELRRALVRGEFEVYLQPQADVETNRILGAEALVRWRHPERGLILPDEFIPIAEESDLILEIGELVLRAACEQAARREVAGLPTVCIAVNISAVQFREPSLAGTVASVLNETGLDPCLLELEITESTAMRHAVLALDILRDLTALGVKVSLDDFGTGYSSLQHLREFPIHALKIDRSFVSGVTVEANDAAIVRAIIAIGQCLGLKVIAEGIETLGQLAFLKDGACDWYQGFLLGGPMREEAFGSLLERHAA
jgi:EAL domain-containing protein (putative c-di-GMP-specific phosphodiesterase class I)